VSEVVPYGRSESVEPSSFLLSQAVASNIQTVQKMQMGISIGDAPKKCSVTGIMMRKTIGNIPS
jgi:hypothetical protein